MALKSTRSLVLATISLHQMAGGLERNIIRLANAMVERGYQVTLVTFDRSDGKAFFPIDERVLWSKVGETKPHHRVTFLQRLRLIRRCRAAIARTGDRTIVICFHHGILIRLMLASILLKASVICSERNSLTHYNFIKLRKWNLNFLALFLVRRIVVQFPSYVLDYPRLIRRKISVIANPVLPAEVFARPAVPNKDGRYILLSVARFSHQKNIDVLIRAYSDLAPRHPKWDLVVVGDGERRHELEALVATYGLGERVLMPGKSAQIHEWFVKSNLFCISSKWEGFPNVLAEALAHGLPSVGFQGCAGVKDLIKSAENGLLAKGNGDCASLRDALDLLMSNGAARTRAGAAATESMAIFEPSSIFSSWDLLLRKLMGISEAGSI
jgi:GalNAc-alpha-(1->4)-GalNAc-alpha-(1->3)-diNAcBac-PP-undecaprenol alpha-1,4-N-acetyl-D-galactosaminyltransferase